MTMWKSWSTCTLLLTVGMAWGCGKAPVGTKEDTGQDVATDADADAGADADADAGPPDVDADADADGGPPDVDADADADGGPPDADADSDDTGTSSVPCDAPISVTPIDDCVADSLRCNVPKMHTTRDGTTQFSSTEYRAWGCVMPEGRYMGPERAYSVRHPGGGSRIEIALTSPCGQLDLIVIPWTYGPGGGVCPTVSDIPASCEVSHNDGDDSLVLISDIVQDYIVVVDGPTGDRANYQVEARCL